MPQFEEIVDPVEETLARTSSATGKLRALKKRLEEEFGVECGLVEPGDQVADPALPFPAHGNEEVKEPHCSCGLGGQFSFVYETSQETFSFSMVSGAEEVASKLEKIEAGETP